MVDEPNQKKRNKNRIYMLDKSRNERRWYRNKRVNDRTRGKQVGRKRASGRINVIYGQTRDARVDERTALHCICLVYGVSLALSWVTRVCSVWDCG